MEEKFDAVVIGSGAGGAPLAYKLVKAGLRVCILEKGPFFRPQEDDTLSDFKRDELFATGPAKRITIPGMKNYAGTYYSSHVEPDLNDEPHIYFSGVWDNGSPVDYATIEGYTAQLVGGGTQLYGGVSFRFPKRDFCLQTKNQGRDLCKNPDPDQKRLPWQFEPGKTYEQDLIKLARDWPIQYDDLEPFYDEAEYLVGINGCWTNQLDKPHPNGSRYQQPLEPNPISQFIATGMDSLGMERYRTPLAVITEPYETREKDEPLSARPVPPDREDIKSGYVNRYGDPIGYKSSTWLAFLRPVSDRDNLQIRANCVVTHLECTRKGDEGEVTKVHYLDPSGKQCFVSGDKVIVACSAIESVRLLLLSATYCCDFKDLLNKHNNGMLGKYFLSNCFGGASVVVPDGRFDKSISLDSDWATDYCATEDFLKEHHLWAGGVIYNNTSDRALPISMARTYLATDLDKFWDGFNGSAGLTGLKLERFLNKELGKTLSVAFMANQVPLETSQIRLHPRIKDKWGRPVAYIIKDWHSHDRYLMDVMADYCARILANGTGVPHEEISAGGVYKGEGARPRIANHILGGARFGKYKEDSVLDPNCKAWNFTNLFVTDGSFMPTSGGANPTLTIQANSLRVADYILKDRSTRHESNI